MVRGAAGWFVRRRLVEQAIWIAAGVGMVFGLLWGLLFFWVLPQWFGLGWAIVIWVTTAVGILSAILKGWNIDNLEKGLDAETLVGQTIERAIVQSPRKTAPSRIRSRNREGVATLITSSPHRKRYG